jgi:hypothetical protein
MCPRRDTCRIISNVLIPNVSTREVSMQADLTWEALAFPRRECRQSYGTSTVLPASCCDRSSPALTSPSFRDRAADRLGRRKRMHEVFALHARLRQICLLLAVVSSAGASRALAADAGHRADLAKRWYAQAAISSRTARPRRVPTSPRSPPSRAGRTSARRGSPSSCSTHTRRCRTSP